MNLLKTIMPYLDHHYKTFMYNKSLILFHSVPVLSFTFLSVHRFNSVDMSVAVATDQGLITPIVSQADRKVNNMNVYLVS